jgi:hypothetical protein
VKFSIGKILTIEVNPVHRQLAPWAVYFFRRFQATL